MLIRYKGGRTMLEVSLNRKPYYFTKENNRILDIKEQVVINYIFSLPNRAEFEVVMEEPRASIPFDGEDDIVNLKPQVKETEKPKKKKGGK